jgi:hypothetical protein
MDNGYQIGRHYCAFDEPDTIFMRLDGDVSAEEGSILNRMHAEMGKDQERLFLLIDMAKLGGMDPEVRKESGLMMKTLPLRGIAVFHASLKAKVFAKLIVSAMNIFKSAAERAPLEVFDSEQEARAWIARRREQLMKTAA